jgi:guanylate kinase
MMAQHWTYGMKTSERGNLFVITAPSGAGKTTLVKKMMARHPNLQFSISYTTRQKRDGEQEGKDYFFIDEKAFEAMRANGEFLEHAEVFGNFYATGREQISKQRDAGHNVLLEIDWQGARQVRSHQPDCCSIFILPPSVQELEHRLRGRKTDSEETIRRRLGEAVADMSHWEEFDHMVINDDLENAASALETILAGRSASTEATNPALRERVSALLNGVRDT